MPSTTSKGRKGSKSTIRQFRSDVAKLKDKGLVSKRVDARSQRETRYMRTQVKKFADVLSGKAAVVTVKDRAKREKFANAFVSKGRHVIVPKDKNERIRYDPRSNTITGYIADFYGHPARRMRLTSDISSAADLPKGANITYTLPLAGGIMSVTKDDPDDFISFIMPYAQGPGKIYNDIWKYVIIERHETREDAADAVDNSDL